MATRGSPSAVYEIVTRASEDAAAIAMVHGVSQDHRLFDRQVAAFEGTCRLILIDLPGHGRSSAIPGPYGVQEYAASIDGALRDAGVDQCHFWGTHLGAGAGLLLACQRPDLFRSLILEAPVFPGRPLPSVSDLLRRISVVAKAQGIAAAREIWWQEGGWFEVMRRRPTECRAAAQRRMIDDFGGQPWLDAGLISRPVGDIGDRLAVLETPSLIISGEHDLRDFLNIAEDLEAIMPKASRVTIPEAGGFPLWEFPDRVNQVVMDFLGRR
ncbi:MAG: alpha/beta hydrolase [Alphaproteobacteria bacterium]